jgi:hypothetical protein
MKASLGSEGNAEGLVRISFSKDKASGILKPIGAEGEGE